MKKKIYKVAIATLYDSINCGTFLQAYALKTFLERKGCEVLFIDTERKNFLKKFFLNIKTKNIQALMFRIRTFFKFRKENRKFVIGRDLDEYDAVFIGSDEVWNVTNNTFYHNPVYFGKNINSNHIFTYAVSCAQATMKELMQYDDFKNIGKNVDLFSVRDDTTNEVLKLMNIEAIKVGDPTLLIDWGTTVFVNEHKWSEKKYILIYAFSVSDKMIEEIQAYARERELKIITVCMFHSWCDENISISPLEFLTAVKHAEMIFTGTFHGTVFATLMHKRFIVISNKQNKINNFLRDYGLLERVVDEELNNINKVASQEINYDEVEIKLNRMRKISEEYIENALYKMKGQ